MPKMLKKFMLGTIERIKESIKVFFWFFIYSSFFIWIIPFAIYILVKLFEPFLWKDNYLILIFEISIIAVGGSLLIAKYWNCFCFKKLFDKKYKPYIHNLINYLDKLIHLSIFIVVLGSMSIMSEVETFNRENNGALESQKLIQKEKENLENGECNSDLESQMLIQKERENLRIKIKNQFIAPLLLISCSCFVYDYKMRSYYKKEKVEIEIKGMLTKVYDGKAIENPKVEIKGSEEGICFQWYKRRENKEGNIIWDEMMENPINAGVYGVKAVLEETIKYERAESKFKDFEIEKASSTIEIKDKLNKVYDGEAVEDPKDIEKTGSSGEVKYEWYEKEVARSGGETWKLLEKAPQYAGYYKVKANLEADQNYLSAEVEKEFAITEK